LNQRANKIAHYLQKLGVGLGSFVGIYLERSLEMVVAVLGILKAGGAYVPLDPASPLELNAAVPVHYCSVGWLSSWRASSGMSGRDWVIASKPGYSQ